MVKQIFDEFEKRGQNWFMLTDDAKDDILADLTYSYFGHKKNRGVDMMTALEHLSQDIDKVREQDRFELADMLKHIRESLVQVINETKQNNNNGKL
jgi:hypothetical protein